MKYYCKSKHPCQFVLPGTDGNFYCGKDSISCSHKEGSWRLKPRMKLEDILSVCSPDWLEMDGRCVDVSKIGIPQKLLQVPVKEITGFDDGLTIELMTGSSPCEHLPVGSLRRAREAIQLVYSYSAVGSGLHIVLDDENVEDEHIKWCLENSIPNIKSKRERIACEKCAELLLQIPLASREQLVSGYGRDWW